MEGGKRLLYEGEMTDVNKTMDTKIVHYKCEWTTEIIMSTIYNWQIQIILIIFI